jgi:beta propeller repeat protein
VNKITKQQTNPDVSGNRIVWTDRRNDEKVSGGYNPVIYMRDDAGRIVPVCTNTGPQYNPKIYGNHIVWEDSRNGYHDIYVCDLKTYPQSFVKIIFSLN